VAYAAALAELEGLRMPAFAARRLRRGRSSGRLAVAASGGSLLQRVKRVLGAPSHAGRAPGWLAAGVALLVVAALSVSAVNTDARGTGQIAISQVEPVEAVLAPAAPPATTFEAVASAMATTPLPAMAVVPPAATSALPVVASTSVASDQAATTRESSGNFVWSDNGQKLEINYRGEIEFSNDDTDVARMSPGAMLRIRDGRRWLSANTSVEVTADGSGNIQRRFWVGLKEQPFEPEGRKWLAGVLPRFIRQSGIAAPARVARIYKSGGVTGVLAEISRIDGSWAKHAYFKELMKSPGLSAPDAQRAFTQAGAEIDSDFELASFLISSSKQITDDATRRAYLDAARSIQSDFELRRVLSSVLQGGVVPSPLAAGLLETSTSIDSDFEEASLLVQFAKQQPIDGTVHAPFFKALATVSSSFEHGRVLQALLQRSDLSPEARAGALDSSAAIGSDFEIANVLLQFVKSSSIEGVLRAPFFRAASTIDSAFERGRVLQALAKRTDLSDETVLELVRSSRGVSSHFERSQVLLAVASNHTLSRDARDAYIDASEGLGDHEQGRVLSALVKNERRRSSQ
jgi:hypothetical protein